MRSIIIFPIVAILFLALTVPVRAEVPAEQQMKIERASNVLRNALAPTHRGIPLELFDKAQGVAIIPGALKSAFPNWERHGYGVMVVRTDKDTWSSPAFISFTGASLGAQTGVDARDLILVFNTRKGIDALKNGKLQFGVNTSLAAGPLTGTGEWMEQARPNVDVYAYSGNAGGLFAAMPLTGSVMRFDKKANARFYGEAGITPAMVFARGPVTATKEKNPLTCLAAKATWATPTC